MEKEYKKIQQQVEHIIPLEETLQKLKELENLHMLIKNKNNNFNLTNEELEMAKRI